MVWTWQSEDLCSLSSRPSPAESHTSLRLHTKPQEGERLKTHRSPTIEINSNVSLAALLILRPSTPDQQWQTHMAGYRTAGFTFMPPYLTPWSPLQACCIELAIRQWRWGPVESNTSSPHRNRYILECKGHQHALKILQNPNRLEAYEGPEMLSTGNPL